MKDVLARFAVAAAATAAIAAVALPAAAQKFDVPQGFATEIVRKAGLAENRVSVLRVKPAQGDFAGLSHIDLAPLPEAVADPDDWLRRRVTASLEGVLPDPHTLLDGADSPFGDPAFDELRGVLARWMDGVAGLGDLPLEFCDAPATAANALGEFREMRCALPLGPFRRYLVMRLQDVEGTWYYTRISTMNARRLADLLRIADSFRGDATP